MWPRKEQVKMRKSGRVDTFRNQKLQYPKTKEVLELREREKIEYCKKWYLLNIYSVSGTVLSTYCRFGYINSLVVTARLEVESIIFSVLQIRKLGCRRL